MHPFSSSTVTEREQPTHPGVPRLLDQYKQRRQAWLAQADELLRLRDEARLAAEREALEIVTAARRDVRRIVVQARRELLVLTAQLHAAVESVDQASLGASAEEAVEAPAHQALVNNASLGTTRELVMGARREVRSVLDEARAEIEALAAEASGPLRDERGALAAAVPEPPIPTLDTILGSDPVAPRAPVAAPDTAQSTPTVDLRNLASERLGAIGTAGTDSLQAIRQPSWLPTIEASPITPLGVPMSAAPMHVEEAVSLLAVADARTPFLGFPETERVNAVDSHLAAFGETGPIPVPESPRVFLADLDDGRRSRPAWLWVGLFAATGVLAIGGTGWWFTTRDTRGVLAAPVATAAGSREAEDRSTPLGDASPATVGTSVASASPAVLSIEVRRTAWIRTLVDGKEDSRVYQAGESRQIVGAKAVSIRAGDAGAVFVSLDGRPAEPLGTSGLAVTKQYSLAAQSGVTPAVATVPGPQVAAAAVAAAAESAVGGVPRAVPDAAPTSSRAVEPPRPASPGVPTPSAPAAAAAPPAAAGANPASAPGSTPAAADASPTGNGRADLVTAGQQWLDAYQRRDRDAMSTAGTENMSVSDERSVTERFPAWQVGVRRDLDQVELELTGDTALLTARMTERSGEGGTTSAQHVSRVSQIWVRRSGRWRVADVRIIGEARLNQIVR